MRLTVVHKRAFVIGVAITGLAFARPVLAQTSPRAETPAICVAIDEAHDTLSPADRTAARLLLSRQFELEGWRVTAEGCANEYLVSHVKLGSTITVTVAGPAGHREGTALGVDDLPALYSQMVRSIVTGQPMIGMNVIDRTNVTEAQASDPKRVASDSFSYARLGAGNAGPGFGFGYRAERDTFALDISFLNFQGRFFGTSIANGGDGSVASSLSYLKLEGLHFFRPAANTSAYCGGGLSWGLASSTSATTLTNWTSWNGSGLQAELTAGYEFGRASTMRVFVQADAVLPFYQLTSNTGGERYSPSVTVSIGLGWQRGRR